jgi:hypothetical protein
VLTIGFFATGLVSLRVILHSLTGLAGMHPVTRTGYHDWISLVPTPYRQKSFQWCDKMAVAAHPYLIYRLSPWSLPSFSLVKD